MSSDELEALTDRRRRQLVLQGIIDAMTRDPSGWRADAAARELERRIADYGLPAMPAPWLQAVASGIARGEPYVVSARTAEQMDVPAPRTSRKPYGIS